MGAAMLAVRTATALRRALKRRPCFCATQHDCWCNAAARAAIVCPPVLYERMSLYILDIYTIIMIVPDTWYLKVIYRSTHHNYTSRLLLY